MSPLEKFLANLRRLLGPRTGPTAESTPEPYADRPPSFEPATPEPTASHGSGVVDDITPVDEPTAVAVTSPADDATEVRALLEAVAGASESTVQFPPSTPQSAPAPLAPEPALAPAPAPASLDEQTEVPADDASAAPARVGDALVLTLATPAATFTIVKSSATLGRGQENTIRLDDLSVSRRHARIAYRQGGYWLSDLGSMGGTWIDGTRLNAPRRIAAGEVIDIGLCRLTASFAAAQAKTEMTKSANPPRSEMAAQGRRKR